MVSGSLTEEETEAANTRLKVGFVLLVAGSMVLMALQGDLTALQLLGVFVIGVVVGLALLWYVLRNLREFRESLKSP